MTDHNEAEKKCPLCGKIMAEEPKFKGLWCCPDSKIRLNDSPPFRFKCDGVEVTDEAVAALDEEMARLHLKHIARLN